MGDPCEILRRLRGIVCVVGRLITDDLGILSSACSPRLLRTALVNYPDLPRSGLPGPRLLRSGLPVSASDLVPDVGTVVPDSAGDFPSQVVRSVPLLPVGPSATTDDARFLSRLNTAGDVVSIILPRSTARVVKPWNKAEENDDGIDEALRVSFAHQKSAISGDAVSPPYSLVLQTAVGSSTLVEGGGLAPAYI